MIKNSLRTFSTLVVCLALLTHLSACGILLGNVKPVDEKSDDYRVLDLSKSDPDWKKLEPITSATPDAREDVKKNRKAFTSEVSDISFQSEKTASIISLNTACRGSRADDTDLKAISNQLLLGISNITHRSEKVRRIQDVPALETSLQGKLNGEQMALRTVVIHKDACIYDLMYMARPENFESQAPDFDRFVASLRLR